MRRGHLDTSVVGPSIVRSHSRFVVVALAACLLVAVLLGCLLAPSAQAYSYSTEETAFVKLINDYRAASGLPTLLVSDSISEACYRHNHDMAKYSFFSHYSTKSDWFASNALPWDRMALSGYSYNTNKGENIAAGQVTAAEVFAAWKASSGHNENMLNSAYKVIGISLYKLSGSPYTYYWTTDFGGYVDATAHTVSAAPTATTASTTSYQQTDSRIKYSGTWYTFTTSGASGGSYKRANNGAASCTVTFNGTYLAWIATKGTTLGKAYVSIDGGSAKVVDLARSSVAYQQNVWNTGTLANGTHTVKIWWYSSNLTGKYISVDRFDVKGSLV